MSMSESYYLKQQDTEGRVEARAKVTGKGKYAAEYTVDNLCHGVLVGSTIPSGRIIAIDTEQARQVTGVIDCLSHQNRPLIPGFSSAEKIKESGFGLPIFHTDKIHFKGQPIALVIAETLEEALYAAALVKAEYEEAEFDIDFDKKRQEIALQESGKERGTLEAWKQAKHVVEQSYSIKAEVHHPMEMHATIAAWTAEGHLELHDKNQGVNNVQQVLAGLYQIPKEQIHVVSEYVGGGFGSGLRVWPHVLAATMAAKQVNRPVKIVLTRPQMFVSTGYRPASWQRIRIGADEQGRLLGIHHQAMNGTSTYENFNEGITRVTRLIYDFPNLKAESATVPLHMNTPTWMRGPGDCTGDFAVESAIDELCYTMQKDPVQIRLDNIASVNHPDNKLPWSTHFLKECVTQGAKMIGWEKRSSQPRSRTDGDWHVGYGMAVGMWNASRGKASAAIRMTGDGHMVVQTAMTDIGTGTGTGMLNIAHDVTGIPKHQIHIELGNSNLPPAPSQGGSTGMSSVSGAVVAVSNALKLQLAQYAAKSNPGFNGVSADEVMLSADSITLPDKANVRIAYTDLWANNLLGQIHVEATSEPGEERKKYAFCSSAAHFCQVRVHQKTGKVKIDRMVCVADGGTVINQRAAANQMSGAAVGGIGMALMEEQFVEHKLGGLIADDLAGYHFPVNADAPIVEVAFIGKPDPNINPSGAKGLGEVGIIGTAAAISNAIYNATGKRLRDLPMTPDKVLLATPS
ncbi:xanthine dehydrogenase family protein molybdopterin-binding subunit [Sphingobacterium chungjuense]|uniref:xanthine dehydrogenase family protein molybdopterin-binding subunit n=1 Tax=Sphingobacterium chungjuense TaxID=2675553 RepID=UPI001F0E89B0|nr:xanthine dehydrogenase family protein molybdopterin-binding subunit [Sphingobacterium chungjuense]